MDDLYLRCRRIFIQLREFESIERLRALFVTGELFAYKHRIRQATDISGQVDSLLDELWGQKLDDGRLVISLFLVTLLERYEGHPQFDDLRRLHLEIEQSTSKIIDLPIVIAAMTNGEANELKTEVVFNNPAVPPESHERFQPFKLSFQEHMSNDWVAHYGTHRSDWQPYLDQSRPIHKILWEIASEFNVAHQISLGQSIVRPKYLSNDFFSSDEHIRINTWRQLRQSGCILIIDSVSLFHPILRQKLSNSPIITDEKTAMFVLSPVNPINNPINILIENEIHTQMERAFMRFSEPMEHFCVMSIGDLRTLQRVLFSTFPIAAEMVHKQKPLISNRERIRNLMGEPRGIDKLVFGEGGVQ